MKIDCSFCDSELCLVEKREAEIDERSVNVAEGGFLARRNLLIHEEKSVWT